LEVDAVIEKRSVDFKNVDEVLAYAIKGEVEAHAFYAFWSKKLTDKALQKVFEELAGEELKHKEFLLGIKKGQSLKPSDKEIVDLKISDYTVDVKASTDMNYQDALALAMQKEKEAFKMYSGLALMSINEDMKSTFKALAQEEAKHKLRLEIMYDEEILKEN
jgi:rubrerythrin